MNTITLTIQSQDYDITVDDDFIIWLSHKILDFKNTNITKQELLKKYIASLHEIFLIEMMKYFEPCIGQINNPKPEEALIFILELIDIYIGEKIMFEADRKVSYKKLRAECLQLFINYLGINK